MENNENQDLKHRPEENREREKGTQAIQEENSGAEGNGSVFGHSPRIVVSNGAVCDTEAPGGEREQATRLQAATTGEAPAAVLNQTPDDQTNPGGEMITNTGDDINSKQTDADAASG